MKKKISAVFLMAAALLTLTACGSNSKKPENTDAPHKKVVSEGSGNMGSVTGDQLQDFGSGTTEHSDTNTASQSSAPVESDSAKGSLQPKIDSKNEGSLSTNGFTLTFGDYTVTVMSCEETLDINNCHSLRVKYSFTNNSKSQATFSTSILATASQGSYRLASTSPAVASDPEYSAQLQFVQPGESITCAAYYLLDDTSTDVVLNIANMLSSNDSISLTYSFDSKD